MARGQTVARRPDLSPVARIPFIRASLPPPEAWVPYLEASFRESRFSNFGPLHERFAGLCAERYAAPGYGVLPVANATVGVTAVLLALGVSGRVVLPSFTFPATLHAVLAAGCEPVLCDVDPVTWEIDCDHLERLLDAGNVEAVVAVRSYGFVRAWERLKALGVRRGFQLVVDSAASFGHPGRKGAIGSGAGEVEVFSLHATKVFSVGEGGLVFAPRDVIERLRGTVNFGFGADRSFAEGGNMKLDEIRCAIGLVGLEFIEAVVAVRAAQAAALFCLFGRYPELVATPVDTGPTPWQAFPCRIRSPGLRERMAARLAAAGIETRAYYAPTLAGGYRGTRHVFDPRSTPESERLAGEMLCFPIYESMSADEQASLLRETEAALMAESG